jgi:hypothetical protein
LTQDKKKNKKTHFFKKSLIYSGNTCDANEKFGPGERFLLGTGGVLIADPELEPLRFLRLLAGLWASVDKKKMISKIEVIFLNG